MDQRLLLPSRTCRYSTETDDKAIIASNLAEDRKMELLRARRRYLERKRERERERETAIARRGLTIWTVELGVSAITKNPNCSTQPNTLMQREISAFSLY
ncbi:hypothetical protein [Tsuneonella flava]|uniref:hypothetical protein n=1 Tax=Tsuneonella flava TaxID=2055955 RepID=UPI000F4C9721|nr:hypothetical protein [Tsuneonella flava]